MTQPPENNPSEEFLRTIHELNNLLAVLQGHAEALSRGFNREDPRYKHLEAFFDTLLRAEMSVRGMSEMLHGRNPADVLPILRPAESSRPLWGTEKILLVDDETALRGVTGRFLGMNGYRVLEAGGVEGAMEAFGRVGGEVDVLITDMMMGERGGVELARRLRAEKPGLKVVFLSGQDAEDMRRQADEVGSAQCLTKPFRPKELLQLLREVLDQGSPALAD